LPETLTGLDVPTRNRHGTGRESLGEPALLGQHLVIPDQHQRDALERRSVVHAREILSFDRSLVQPSFHGARYGRGGAISRDTSKAIATPRFNFLVRARRESRTRLSADEPTSLTGKPRAVFSKDFTLTLFRHASTFALGKLTKCGAHER
jgi:hypothetical protein